MNWVRVARTYSLEEAEIIAGLLRSYDIPCEIHYEAWERVVGLHISPVDVLVPEDQAEDALKLLPKKED